MNFRAYGEHMFNFVRNRQTVFLEVSVLFCISRYVFDKYCLPVNASFSFHLFNSVF